MDRDSEEARIVLHQRLLARRGEIEQALLTRVYALANPQEALDPEYTDGLRAAVGSALDYGLTTLTPGPDLTAPIPAPLLTQVRLAARNGIGLDTVLRRYLAGYTLLNDILHEEAAKADAGGTALQRLTRSQAVLFDRLLAVVSEEYLREVESQPDPSSEQRRAERIEGLLAGELLDTSALGYDFEAFHLGVIAAGREAAEAIRKLAASIDCQLLLVRRGEERAWAWLGSRRGIDPTALQARVSAERPARAALAVGEPARGLPGWRLTHAQAGAALTIALRSPRSLIRYAEVALLASMLQDDLLATSLRGLYLEPLADERDGGGMARETLRAYFAAGRNGSSAAAALGVSRQSISKRLRTIEERLGCPLDACAPELETALRMEELGDPKPPPANVNLDDPAVVT
jgi:PucR C-terminal helix-turn-helix domain/GGDEF-like domain